MINFSKDDFKQIDNFKGGDKYILASIFEDELNKILKFILVRGASIGLHTHEDSSEVIYIIKGTAKFIVNGEVEYVREGNCHYCPKGFSHMMINDTDKDVEAFAVVPKQ